MHVVDLQWTNADNEMVHSHTKDHAAINETRCLTGSHTSQWRSTNERGRNMVVYTRTCVLYTLKFVDVQGRHLFQQIASCSNRASNRRCYTPHSFSHIIRKNRWQMTQHSRAKITCFTHVRYKLGFATRFQQKPDNRGNRQFLQNRKPVLRCFQTRFFGFEFSHFLP